MPSFIHNISRLSTAAVRVRFQVKSCGICGGRSGTEAGFLRVTSVPPANSHSNNCSIVINGRRYMLSILRASLHNKLKNLCITEMWSYPEQMSLYSSVSIVTGYELNDWCSSQNCSRLHYIQKYSGDHPAFDLIASAGGSHVSFQAACSPIIPLKLGIYVLPLLRDCISKHKEMKHQAN
jgi:hypothetical protein